MEGGDSPALLDIGRRGHAAMSQAISCSNPGS